MNVPMNDVISVTLGPRKVGRDFPVSVGGRGNKGFAAETAEATGLSKRRINQLLRHAHNICQPARDLIRNTPLDKGVYLDQLVKARLSDDEQVDKVKRDLEAHANKVRPEATVEAATCRRVLNIAQSLRNLPLPEVVADCFSHDDALLLDERIDTAAAWFAEFVRIWKARRAAP